MNTEHNSMLKVPNPQRFTTNFNTTYKGISYIPFYEYSEYNIVITFSLELKRLAHLVYEIR